MQGWLTKAPEQEGLSSLGMGWRKRFFVHDGAARALRWFADENADEKKAKGSLDLREVTALRRSRKWQGKKQAWGFELVTSERVFVLCAETEDGLVQWMKDLRPSVGSAGNDGGGAGSGDADGAMMSSSSGGGITAAELGREALLSSSAAGSSAVQRGTVEGPDGKLLPWVKGLMQEVRGVVVHVSNDSDTQLTRCSINLEGHQQAWAKLPPEVIEPGETVSFGTQSNHGIFAGTTANCEYDFFGCGGSVCFYWSSPFVQLSEAKNAISSLFGSSSDDGAGESGGERKATTSTTTVEFTSNATMSRMPSSRVQPGVAADVLVVNFVVSRVGGKHQSDALLRSSLSDSGSTALSPLGSSSSTGERGDTLPGASWKRALASKRRTFLVQLDNHSVRYRLAMSDFSQKGNWASPPPEKLSGHGGSTAWATHSPSLAGGKVSYQLLTMTKSNDPLAGNTDMYLLIQWSLDFLGSAKVSAEVVCATGDDRCHNEVQVVQVGETAIENAITTKGRMVHAFAHFELRDQGDSRKSTLPSVSVHASAAEAAEIVVPQEVGATRDLCVDFFNQRLQYCKRRDATVDLVNNRHMMVQYEVGSKDTTPSGGRSLFKSLGSKIGVGDDGEGEAYIPKCVDMQPMRGVYECHCCQSELTESSSFLGSQKLNACHCALCGFVIGTECNCARRTPIHSAIGDSSVSVNLCRNCDSALAFHQHRSIVKELRDTASTHPLVLLHKLLTKQVADVKHSRLAVMLAHGDSDAAANKARSAIQAFRNGLAKLSEYHAGDPREDRLIANMKRGFSESSTAADEDDESVDEADTGDANEERVARPIF